MYKKIACLSFVIFIMAGCSSYSRDYDSVEFTVSGETALMIGIIDSDIPDQVIALLEDYPQITTIVMQDVEGSVDDEANLIAARYIRENGLNTHIPEDGLVASGGTDFFLSGVKRTASPGAKIGIHSWVDDQGTEGALLSRNDSAHKTYLDYYGLMGIPAEFYWFTLEVAPSEEIHWMTIDEQQLYKITTH
ncbi:MAG: hypothetical protein ACRBB4_00125 [Neptuniibacter sp.]